jgi:hAT family C-terminal dimerisation region
VRGLWEQAYKGKYGLESPGPTDNINAPAAEETRRKGQDNRFGGLHKHKQTGARPRTSSHQYLAYISTASGDGELDSLEYWNARHSTQPDLARFALDMLAIPMMSAECERVFSSAKHLVTDSRNRLNPEIIEANECLRHWFGKLEPELQEPDSEAAAAEEDEMTTASNENYESDTVDDIVYQLDSDGEIVIEDR